MPRGGKREGAGRKSGAASKRTREIADKAAAAGITPLDVMMQNMRFAYEEAAGLLAKILETPAGEAMDTFKELMRMRNIAQECAKDAAPYIHPRLAAVEHSGEMTLHHEDALSELE